MKVRVPIIGTIGKSVQFDPDAGARAEAAVAALAAQISVGVGGTILHRNLLELQVGDDHPQYAGNAFPETITGLWNFSTIPFIQGNTLAEYIEDVVGGSFFDFLQDTTSVVWTYRETANELEANVPQEFVQDAVGAMLTDTTSIDLAYNDASGTFTASIIDEYVQDLVGAMLTDSSSIDFTYNDGAGTFTAAIIDEYIQDLVGAMLADSSSIDFTYTDASGTFTASTINANPTGTVGLTAVNGSAATPMRSDGAPALSQSISPRWTGNHEFFAASGVPARFLRQGIDGAGIAGVMSIDTDAKTAGDAMLLVFRANNSSISTHDQAYGFLGLEIVSPTAGAESSSFDFYTINGGAGPGRKVTIRPGGALGIVDGITAPSAYSGFAQIYVDSADGDLKVIFSDGTIKTIVTD